MKLCQKVNCDQEQAFATRVAPKNSDDGNWFDNRFLLQHQRSEQRETTELRHNRSRNAIIDQNDIVEQRQLAQFNGQSASQRDGVGHRQASQSIQLRNAWWNGSCIWQV
jgi:hypothetical protein